MQGVSIACRVAGVSNVKLCFTFLMDPKNSFSPQRSRNEFVFVCGPIPQGTFGRGDDRRQKRGSQLLLLLCKRRLQTRTLYLASGSKKKRVVRAAAELSNDGISRHWKKNAFSPRSPRLCGEIRLSGVMDDGFS
jgi:hypothetical protein